MASVKRTGFNGRSRTESKDSDIRHRFSAILEKARSLGVTPGQLRSLESVKAIRDAQKVEVKVLKVHRKTKWKWIVFCVALLTFISCLAQWPLTRQDLTAVVFGFNRFGFDEEQCLVSVDSPIAVFARPPVDCRICHGLTAVDRVSGISQETFESRYAYSGRPLVVTDAMENWTAVNTFSFDFFKTIYTDDSPVLTMSEQRCQFFPYRTNFRNLSEVFHMSDDRANLSSGSEPWYIGWSNCDAMAANVLRQHYHRPYFLPSVAESSKTDWIFMGSPGYGAHLHIDNVGNPSWQAQVTGTKIWTLEPPPECYLECVAKIHVTVHPKEIIVLDTNQWFHSTLIVGDKMSITIGSEYD